MESENKTMCKTEASFSGGAAIDYDHGIYDDDCFREILGMIDLPMENVEGDDGLSEDWASELGPIPTEVFNPPSHVGVANGFTDLIPDYSVLKGRTSELKHQTTLCSGTYEDYHNEWSSQPKQQPTFSEGPTKQNIQRHYPSDLKTHEVFLAPSPDSVLESRSSSSNSKGVSFGTEITIPVRTRTKRSRPTGNPWLSSPLIIPINKEKKRIGRPPQLPANMEVKNSFKRPNVLGTKKCTHCEITKTPQWREGPLGPKTLCNACGVRYRSGRLFPEYRPAASPTFVPSLHSNSHRKVIEMRQQVMSSAGKEKGATVTNDSKNLVPTPPEFVPVGSSLLFDHM